MSRRQATAAPQARAGAAVAMTVGVVLVSAGVHLFAADPVASATPIPVTFAREPVSPVVAGYPAPKDPTSKDPARKDPAPKTPGLLRTAAPAPALVPPVSLSFPAYGAEAAVVAVGVVDGALQLPADLHTVGWWAAGAMPGEAAGATVLAGHVDSRLGTGTMRVLLDVAAGDLVEVTDSVGSVHAYRIVERTLTPKSQLDATLFAATRPHRLVLITCGGPFDEEHRSYRDNVVVLADPVP